MRTERLRGYGLALTAAALWATLGLFYHRLEAHSLPHLTIVFFRATVAALILFPILGWRQPNSLKLERRDWLLFAALGLFGVAAFYVVYIYAISLTGMGVAAVLMYTAPAWVTLISALFFKERLTWLKIGALLLACAGCALVGRVYDLDSVRLNLPGILAGLGAGLTYGLYTIFSKVAQHRHTAWGTLAYALGLGGLFMLPLQPLPDVGRALTTPAILFWLLMLGLIPTLVGGVAFNAALRRIPASDASIVATLEPVIAALLGWAFLGEQLESPQLLGAGLILIAVITLRRKTLTN
ncbi:MAG: EamA family transporter [Chloroflexota bacterium]|nr:EamA family transporter [Chloroflexota bacterium]